MDLFNLIKALQLQQDQDEDSMEFIPSKNGVVVGTNEQINKFLASPNGKRHQQVKIVKKPNPKDIAASIEATKKGTRLLTYKNIRLPIKESEYNLKKSLHQVRKKKSL